MRKMGRFSEVNKWAQKLEPAMFELLPTHDPPPGEPDLFMELYVAVKAWNESQA